MEKCKRCLLRESAEADVYEDIKSRIERLSESDRADERTYNSRIEICKACEHLISGVCMKCGCYVEFRSAFKKQACPMKRW